MPHNAIARTLDDSYETILFDSELDDEGFYWRETGLIDRYVESITSRLEKSTKNKVAFVKVGELFGFLVVEEIAKKIQKIFPSKEFILLVDDNREFNTEFIHKLLKALIIILIEISYLLQEIIDLNPIDLSG